MEGRHVDGLSGKAAFEISRVSQLPTREWRDSARVSAMTSVCKTPGGQQTLRPIQAISLEEGWRHRGLFKHGRVGCGKTLTAGLLPYLWGSERPALCVRAADVKDTRDVHAELRRHWKIPRNIRVVSYNFLSDPKNEGWLARNRIDALVLDEGQKAKDIKKSTCAIRIQRHVLANPSIPVAVLSGTLSPHGDLDDYAHLLLWCLRRHAPIPQDPSVCRRWARILRGGGDPAALLHAHDHDHAEELFAERMRLTPGVVISSDFFDDVPLKIVHKIHDASEASRENFHTLRTLWEAPDGWSYSDDESAFQTAEVARQFANGFWYGHVPRPPPWFLKIRKAWTRKVSQLVEAGVADSEGSIRYKIREGKLSEGLEELKAWDEAKASFPLKTQAEWVDLDAVKYASEWITKHKRNGLVWVQHTEVGLAIAKVTGCKFIHGQTSENILKETGDRCVITSIQHAGTSKNLQYAFWKNLFLNPPANGEAIEQAIGRTHREGASREVLAEFYVSCREHRQAVLKSIQAAGKISRTLSPQKMQRAPLPDVSTQDHPAWAKSIPLNAE